MILLHGMADGRKALCVCVKMKKTVRCDQENVDFLSRSPVISYFQSLVTARIDLACDHDRGSIAGTKEHRWCWSIIREKAEFKPVLFTHKFCSSSLLWEGCWPFCAIITELPVDLVEQNILWCQDHFSCHSIFIDSIMQVTSRVDN